MGKGEISWRVRQLGQVSRVRANAARTPSVMTCLADGRSGEEERKENPISGWRKRSAEAPRNGGTDG